MSSRVIRRPRAIALVLVFLSSTVAFGMGGASAAPLTPAQSSPRGAVTKNSVVQASFEPAAGVPSLETGALAHVRVAASAGISTVRVVLRTSGAAALRGPVSTTVSVPRPSGQVVVDAPYAVTGTGPSVVDAEITALDSGSGVVAVQLAHLWVEGFADGVAQSANGPSDARIRRLVRLHDGGQLADADFASALDSAVAGSDTPSGGQPVTPAATPLVATVVSGTVKYKDSAGTDHPVRRAPVELRAVTATGSDLLATVATDDAGKYSATADSSGRQVFIRAFSKGEGFAVQTTTGVVYFIQSPASAPGPAVTINLTAALDDAAHDVNGALNVADSMVTGVDYTKRLRGSKFPDIKVQFPDATGTNFGGTVGHILRSDRYDWDVNLHEYGHFFADQSGVQDSTLTGDVSHGFGDNLATRYNKAKGEPLAWREGFATYFSLTAQQVMGSAAFGIPHVGDTHYSDLEEGAGNLDVDIESQAGGASLGEDNELSVMRTLWDLFDGAADTGDDRGIAFGDQSVYDTLKGAAAKTMAAGYAAIINGKPARQVADIGCIVTEQRIAPKITAPADKSLAKVGTVPTFTWDAGGDGAALPNDKFIVQLFDATFGGPLLESPEQGGTSFTPTMAQWKTVLDGAGPVVNVVVKGRQSSAPATGPYTSCNIRLIPEKIDLVFAIDTTGSMGPYISGVVGVANSVVDTLAGSGADFRVGVVDYKDVDSPFPGCPPDYDAVTDLAFSTAKPAITGALNSLLGKVAGGCDLPEDVLSGVKRAVDFPWRNGVKKAIILMGDAPGHDPEGHSGLTSASVIAAANAVDPAVIYPILVGFDFSATSFVTNLATGTGGRTFDSNASNVGQAVLDAINAIVASPTANPGGPYTGTVGTPITFDGSGSISPAANIVKWEWDFDNDGIYDAVANVPTVSHTYAAPYNGLVSLRVTDDAGTPQSAVGTAQVTVTRATVATTTTLRATPPSPQGFGSPVTFTATVVPVVPPGSVVFTIDGTAVGTVNLDGAGQASITTASLSPGTHIIKAAYPGTSDFDPSSATLSDIVGCGVTITGTRSETILANSGSTCLVDAHLTGGVVVANGASLAVERSTISGSVSANNHPFAVQMCGSTVRGSVSVRGALGLVIIGDPGDANCASNTIGGSLVLDTNLHGVEAIGNTVGSLVASGNSGPGPYPGDVTTISGNTIKR